MKGAKILAMTIGMLALATGVAFASEAAGEGFHFRWTDFLLRIINFVLFAVILYKLLAKRIRDLLGGRRRKIEGQLSELETRKVQAQERMKDVEQRISNLDQERQKILDEYHAQGEAMRNVIIERAKASAEQIKAQAQVTAAQEAKQVLEQMRAELAERIVAQAQSVLLSRLTKEKHEELIDKYLNKVVLN